MWRADSAWPRHICADPQPRANIALVRLSGAVCIARMRRDPVLVEAAASGPELAAGIDRPLPDIPRQIGDPERAVRRRKRSDLVGPERAGHATVGLVEV